MSICCPGAPGFPQRVIPRKLREGLLHARKSPPIGQPHPDLRPVLQQGRTQPWMLGDAETRHKGYRVAVRQELDQSIVKIVNLLQLAVQLCPSQSAHESLHVRRAEALGGKQDVFPGQLLDLEPIFHRIRMPCLHNAVMAVLKEREKGQQRTVGYQIIGRKNEIRFLRFQRAAYLIRPKTPDRNAAFRIKRPKMLQHACQKRRAAGTDIIDAQRLLASGCPGAVVQRLPIPLQDFLRGAIKDLPLRGDLYEVLIADQQWEAQLRFDLPDELGHGRLGNIEASRGLDEALLLRHGAENLQIMDFHGITR